jgi:hypothetical protein
MATLTSPVSSICIIGALYFLTTSLVPENPDAPYDLKGDVLLSVYGIMVFFVIDQIFKVTGWFPNDKTARYLTLHVVCNGIATFLSFPDTVKVYTQPVMDSAVADYTDTRSCMIIASLHLYHIIAFRPLPMVDWVHHILMVVFTLPLAYMLQPGPVLNHGAFFASGFPGGVDYLMLVCVKCNWMDTMTEKRYNNHIQTWIRNPGMLYHAIFAWQGLVILKANPALFKVALAKSLYSSEAGYAFGILFVMVTYYWNGPYFQLRVAENYAKKSVLNVTGSSLAGKTMETIKRTMSKDKNLQAMGADKKGQ